MNFDLNDEQQEIKRTAHEFLGARFKPEKVRELAEAQSYDDALYEEMAELGWPGIAISEEDGGQGLGMLRCSRRPAMSARPARFWAARGPLSSSRPRARTSSARGGSRGSPRGR